MNLAQRLKRYFDLFSRRTDVKMTSMDFDPGLSRAERAALEDRVPDELLDFYSTFNGVRVSWELLDRAGYRGSGRGGALRLERLDPSTFQLWPLAGWEPIELESYWVLENVNDESYTHVVQGKGQRPKDASLAFFGSGGDGVVRFASLEDYLTRGARQAFAWFWQLGSYWETKHFVNELLAASPPLDAPRALVDWLGDRAVLLPA